MARERFSPFLDIPLDFSSTLRGINRARRNRPDVPGSTQYKAPDIPAKLVETNMSDKPKIETRTSKATTSEKKTSPVSRTEQLRILLRRKSGATCTELQEKFGWQPHTARAAISGLRKAGECIERSSGECGTVYRIIERPANA